MKKIRLVLLTLVVTLFVATPVRALDRQWSFVGVPTVNASDWSKISNDASGNWLSTSRSFYSYTKTANDVELTANGSNLSFLSGLKFSAKRGSTISISVYDYLLLTDSAAISIPSLHAGDTVYVTACYDNASGEALLPSNATPTFLNLASAGNYQEYKLIAMMDGSIRLTSNAAGIRIQKIRVAPYSGVRSSSDVVIDSIYVGDQKNVSVNSVQLFTGNVCNIFFSSKNPFTSYSPIYSTTSDSSIAIVSNGVVTVVGEGTATISFIQQAAGQYSADTAKVLVQVIPQSQYLIVPKPDNANYTIINTCDWLEPATFGSRSGYRFTDSVLAYMRYANNTEPVEVNTYSSTGILNPEDNMAYQPASKYGGHNRFPLVSSLLSGKTMTLNVQYADSIEVYFIGAALNSDSLVMEVHNMGAAPVLATRMGGDVQGQDNYCQFVGYKFPNYKNRYDIKLYAFNGAVGIYAIKIYGRAKINLSIGAPTLTYSKNTREYDGTDVATIKSQGTVSGGLSSTDDAKITSEAHFSQAEPGTDLTVTITYYFDGKDTTKYNLPMAQRTKTLKGTITPRQLFASGVAVEPTKVYDKTTDIVVTAVGNLTNTIDGDDVALEATGAYKTAAVGTNKDVDITYSLTGDKAHCYAAPVKTVLKADITAKQLRVEGTTADSKIYDGRTDALTTTGTLLDTLPGDDVTVVGVGQFKTPIATQNIMVVITYTLNGADVSNYLTPKNDTLYRNITPRQLSANGVKITKVKMYDGNSTAVVLTEATPSGVIPGDMITLTATAFYNDAAAGKNKTINVRYTVNGERKACYIAPVQAVYCVDGKILESTELAGDDNSKFYVNSDGYCQDEVGEILFSIAQGDPTQYKLMYFGEAREQGFVDVNWTDLVSLTQIPIKIPAQCQGGEYKVAVTFRNEIQVESAPVIVDFVVNLPVHYIDQIFEDVVSIDNRENRFYSYQWYHNGDAIPGATLPYYQELGGITGSYYVAVNQGGEGAARTCERTSWKAGKGSPKVSVMPNPASSVATVTLHGFDNTLHVMTIRDTYGKTHIEKQFEGETVNVNVQGLVHGNYLITVDGTSAKLLKR